MGPIGDNSGTTTREKLQQRKEKEKTNAQEYFVILVLK